MIYELKTVYENGFAAVSWLEDRNWHSPQAHDRARVECRIMKSNTSDGKLAELLFVKIGTTRQGGYVEGKPWALLTGFSVQPAERLYWTAEQRAQWEFLAAKGKEAGRVLTTDGAQVVLAGFTGLAPLHVNTASASTAEMDEINYRLLAEFVSKRPALLAKCTRGKAVWPVDDDKVQTYDPERQAPRPSLWFAIGMWALPIGFVAVLLGGMAWIWGLFGR